MALLFSVVKLTLANHPMSFDDRLVRQVLECVIVESKEEIKVVFRGGHEVICTLYR